MTAHSTGSELHTSNIFASKLEKEDEPEVHAALRKPRRAGAAGQESLKPASNMYKAGVDRIQETPRHNEGVN